jgi:hypothetical protein
VPFYVFISTPVYPRAIGEERCVGKVIRRLQITDKRVAPASSVSQTSLSSLERALSVYRADWMTRREALNDRLLHLSRTSSQQLSDYMNSERNLDVVENTLITRSFLMGERVRHM